MRAVALALLLASSISAHADEDEAMGARVQLLLRVHQADVFGCVGEGEPKGEALLRVIVGEGLPLRVEVLKAEPDAQKAASCVASKARRWDLSSLRAHSGDQVVFPLAWRPSGPDQSAVHATMRVQKLGPNGVAHLQGDLVHAVFVAEGATKDLRQGDVLYVDQQPSDVTAGKKGATLVIVEAPRGRAPIANRVLHAPKPYALPGGTVRLYLDGTPTPFALDELCFTAGTDVPAHVHEGSDELVYVERGKATALVGDMQTPQKHAPGDELVIPRGTRHQLHIDQDLCAVQVYAPAGPEQRFKTR